MNALRSGVRTTLLLEGLLEVAASFGTRRLRKGLQPLCVRDRADWLQDAACTVLHRMGVSVRAQGRPPLEGLIVSNHLTYLDVLAYASLAPCQFVAKRAVQGWPVFGRFATMAGTIFVDRERHATNRDAALSIEATLAAGVPVVLFPEGTSSDGKSVLPFRSALFEPVARTHGAVTAAAVGYSSSTAEEATLAYYGEDVFGPHLLRTIGQREVEARVIFSTKPCRYANRKEAARAMQVEVERLRCSIAQQASGSRSSDSLLLTRAG